MEIDDDGPPFRDVAAGAVRAIDLGRAIHRWAPKRFASAELLTRFNLSTVATCRGGWKMPVRERRSGWCWRYLEMAGSEHLPDQCG